MEKNFKTEPVCEGKYIDVKYIEYVPGNITIDVWLKPHTFVQNEAAAKKLMDNVEDFKIRVSELVKERGLPYETTRIIAENIEAIERWGDGLFLIAQYSAEEMTDWIVTVFHDKYVAAKEKCEAVLNGLKENPVSYLDNYRAHDDYKQQNEYWEFGLEPLEPLYKEINFEALRKEANECLEMLIAKSKEKHGKSQTK